jgi:hypothetical protein
MKLQMSMLAAIALTASLTSATAYGASSPTEPSATNSVGTGGTPVGALRVMTPDQYQAALSARSAARSTGLIALATQPLVQPLMTPPPSGSKWWDIMVTYTDPQHRSIPVRVGFSDTQAGNDNSGGGFLHACYDHNMCNENVLQVMFTEETPESTGNDRWQYEAYIVDSGLDIDADVVGSASQSRTGPDGNTTPDGAPFGLVTSFCLGYTDCPEWVNAVQ